MTNPLKKYFALLLAMVLCLGLAACGGNAPETIENIALDDSIDYNFADTYNEYLGFWYLEDDGSLWVSENDGKYSYELYDAYNEVISSGQLQYVKEYRCMYVYSEQEGIAHKCWLDHKLFGSEDDSMLYIDPFGTFSRASSDDPIVVGDDWRTWGIVRDYGTITRYGEDTDVLVCVQVTDAAFYYDSADQVLFDSVDYPLTLVNKLDLSDSVWQAFQSIDFADLNSDGNSDVTMKFKIGWSELVSVWFWDTESDQFVFQPEESQLGKDDGNDVADWRTWGIVCDSGTFTRGGKDTKVLVCVYEEEADFYYDSKEKVMFGSVNYPLTLVTAWDKLRGTDFADLNGDGDSDVTLMFDDQGNEIVMVWFWDTESKQFVFQPEESQLAVPVLRGGALPFPKMKTLQSENREDGTYYYVDATEDEQIMVVSTVMQSHCVYDIQTLKDYLGACALTLGGAMTYHLQTVENNEAYSVNMSYPVYIVTYTAGENEDAREWTVFAMDTDRYTYLYGLCATPDAAEEVRPVYPDVFSGLYLSDGE